MSIAAEPLASPPPALTPELRARIARRRADGRSWEAVGAALKCDPSALRWACASDSAFAAALQEAEAEAEREAELRAVWRLKRLTASDDERVAVRAAGLLVRYVRERRRQRAPELPKTEPATPKADPRPPVGAVPAPRDLAVPKPAVGAFRAVPNLSPERLAELVRGG